MTDTAYISAARLPGLDPEDLGSSPSRLTMNEWNDGMLSITTEEAKDVWHYISVRYGGVGTICGKCRENFEYAEPRNGFVCWGCSHADDF